MVHIGILGQADCGKTSTFIQFIKALESSGDRVLTGQRGGAERELTITVDFIRFTYRGFTHTLYGTGGHRAAVTDYYRVFVLRNADRFLCMIDLTEPLEEQLQFFESIGDIPASSVVVTFNKFDLVDSLDIEADFVEPTVNWFEKRLKRTIQKKLVTVAVDTKGFAEYQQNCTNAILELCEWSQEKAFDVWTSP